jgi:pullulanase/glycogen debranching enzyme
MRRKRGHRFDHRRLLLDPYAREVVGRFSWRKHRMTRRTA